MTARQLLIAFAAGFLSVILFQHTALAILGVLGLSSLSAWPSAPVAPFGVPQILSAAFWGGLWGIVFAFVVPRLAVRMNYWLASALFGAIAPTLVLWFLVLPLKGAPIASGFNLRVMLIVVFVHAVWGLGTGLFIKLFSSLVPRAAGVGRHW